MNLRIISLTMALGSTTVWASIPAIAHKIEELECVNLDESKGIQVCAKRDGASLFHPREISINSHKEAQTVFFKHSKSNADIICQLYGNELSVAQSRGEVNHASVVEIGLISKIKKTDGENKAKIQFVQYEKKYGQSYQVLTKIDCK